MRIDWRRRWTRRWRLIASAVAIVIIVGLAFLTISQISRAQATAPPPARSAPWVQVGPNGEASARVVVTDDCPQIWFGDGAAPMAERAAPSVDFPARTCEASLPSAATLGPERLPIMIDGQALPYPIAHSPTRIAFVGDTGCRIRGIVAQDCRDPVKWPYAGIAARIAATKPDLIVHLGDFHYRESACPLYQPGCAGSPHGYTWAAWAADFFTPTGESLTAAPWLMVRGNHEDCQRGGDGWFRFFDPAPYTGQCADYTPPYVVPFADFAIINLDSAAAEDSSLNARAVAEYRQQLDQVAQLATQPTWLVTHRPIYGLGPQSRRPNALASNATLAAATGHEYPPNVQAMFAGHLHLFQAIAFAAGSTGRPSQWVIGHGGTLLDGPTAISFDGLRVAGELVAPNGALVTDAFGFVTLERAESGDWTATARDRDGAPMVVCAMSARAVHCN